MNMNQIALVRATNIIPFDGVIKPLSNVPYLCKNSNDEFSFAISNLLRELGIRKSFDWSRIDDDEYNASYNQQLEAYLPYTSDYNSMILFSLNGICPDDYEHGFGNNIFSNKKCGIIEPLVSHIDQVISLVPTDTAIKGNVTLSPDAIILIEKQTYDSKLTSQEKEALNQLNVTVKTFEGSLKDAITQELQMSGRYIPETLSLSRSDGGYLPSETSEGQKQLIHQIATTYGKAQALFFHILTGKADDIDKLEDVKDELEKSWKVQDFYLENFLYELLVVMSAPKEILVKLPSNLHSRVYLQKICEYIKAFGIERYKQFLDTYNQLLEQKQQDGTLPTPSEIISDPSKSIKNR